MVALELVGGVEAVVPDCSGCVEGLGCLVFDWDGAVLVDLGAVSEEEGELDVGWDVGDVCGSWCLVKDVEEFKLREVKRRYVFEFVLEEGGEVDVLFRLLSLRFAIE